MAVPFKSTVFTGGSFAASGSNGHSSAGLLIYSSSRSTSGLLPAADLASIGRDVFLYVSGVVGSRGTTTPGTLLVGGDLVISGTAYDGSGNVLGGGAPVYFTSPSTGAIQTTGSLTALGKLIAGTGIQASGSSGITGSLVIKDDTGDTAQLTLSSSAGSIAFDYYSDGNLYVTNKKAAGEIWFSTTQPDATGSQFLRVKPQNSGRNLVLFNNGMTGGSAANAENSTDTSFFVSGIANSRGTSTRGTAVFGGDLYVSGTVYSNEFKTTIISSSIIYSSGSTLFGNSADDTHTFIGNITGSADMLLTGSLTVKGSVTLPGTIYLTGPGGQNIIHDGGSGNLSLYSNSGNVYIEGTLFNGNDVAIAGDLQVNGGDLTTPASTMNIFNSAAYINFGNSAEIRMGGAASTTIMYGSLSVEGSTSLGNASSDRTAVTGSFFSPIISGSLTRLTTGLSYLVAGSNVTITSESNGQVTISSAGGGGGSPGGSNTHVQFNDSGSFGAVSGLTFEKATSTLTGVTISATTGFTGSHTRLADGTSLIAAGVTSATSQTGSIAVTTGSSGQITVASYVFPSDLTVSLSGGRTFGRYATGETIPATGKTPAEVILLAIAQPINPTVATPTATNILTSVWNTTGSVNTSLTGSYTINTLGASVASARLEFRSGSSGTWSILTTSTSTPLLFDHTFTVGANFTSTLNYSHIVVDSAGAAATGSVTLTPQTYTSPTIPTITLARTTLGGITGEGNTTRERGNTVSAITGTITRQRTNAPLSSYAVQYRVDGTGAYIGVPGLSGSIPAVSSTFTFMGLHDETSLLTSVSSSLVYIVSVVDTWQTSSITPSANGITFLSTIFYGTGATAPTTSADVRGLTNKVFTTTANPFTLNTGATNRFFTVALPTRNTSHDTITSVTDTDALGADITANYVNSAFSVGDGGGVNSTYNVYTMEVATPYAADHRHIVTRA